MENWINFDNLPRRKDGKIDWKNCNHNLVEFIYNGVSNSFYIEKENKHRSYLVSYKNRTTTISRSGLTNIQLGSIIRMINIADNKYKKYTNELDIDGITNYKDVLPSDDYIYKIGNILQLKQGNLEVLSDIVLFDNILGYIVKWSNEERSFPITETALLNSSRWGIAPFYKIKPGVNDLWTVRPDIASLLYNHDDGFIYGQFSNKQVEFKCNVCGKSVGKKYISFVSKYGVSCPYCGRGISYPNKLMSNLLNSLKIDFNPEYHFSWCVFPDYNNKNEESYGVYDFVLEKYKMIIEMDGGLGHGHKPHGKSKYSREELIYRDSEKERLANQHGYRVVRIDCNYTNQNKIEYCKTNIIKALSDVFDLSSINWEKLNESTASSTFLEAINLYNEGYSTIEISNLLKRDYTTIIDYLHKGTKLDMCDYIPRAS